MGAGFTLVEVMVALMVFAIATVGLQSSIEQGVLTATRLEEKTVANWVAGNKLIELRMASSAPAQGRQDSEVDMAGRTWSIETEVKRTPVPDMLRIEIRVGLKALDGKIRRITEFLGFIHA